MASTAQVFGRAPNRQLHFRMFSLSLNDLILEEVRRLWAMAEPLT